MKYTMQLRTTRLTVMEPVAPQLAENMVQALDWEAAWVMDKVPAEVQECVMAMEWEQEEV